MAFYRDYRNYLLEWCDNIINEDPKPENRAQHKILISEKLENCGTSVMLAKITNFT